MLKTFRTIRNLRWKPIGLLSTGMLCAAGLSSQISTAQTLLTQILPAQPLPENLQAPTRQPHSLPQTLSKWSSAANADNYFDQVRPLAVGALIWSEWPVRVFIELPATTARVDPQMWQKAMQQAVQDWQPYVALTLVNSAQNADIRISPTPPRQKSGRVRSAETRYSLYISDQKTLAHRVEIYIRSSQTSQYLSAAARHELGHALGIWGHSLNPADVMYFSQVKAPPAISARDINTLVQVYSQPTRLGWPIE